MFTKIFFISVLSSLITATLLTHSYSQCLDDQKSLLLEMKSELIFNSSISEKLVQWNQTDECCNWLGVECDVAGNIISLQLDGEGISGGIGNSSPLFRLEYLEKLNLAFNDFNYTQIPKGIRNLRYLTHLNLSDAYFGGRVPLELSSLRRLVSLDISYDPYVSYDYFMRYKDWDFKPLKLESPNLEMLLQNLTELRELHLDYVDISSQKSEWSANISSYTPHLRILSMCFCGLSGSLDSSLQQLRSLSVIWLDGNNLSTAVPEFLANLSSLTTLSLRNCSLKGTLPKWIFLASPLQYLDLSENRELTGVLPQFIEPGTFIYIYLSSCNFTGFIPPAFANLTQLAHLSLLNNFFTGSISTTLFSGLYNLVVLDLGYNSFTGNIPQSLFALPSLQLLYLNNNQFTGRVEEFPIVNVSNLLYLDFSSNQLEGHIPHSLLQLQGLDYLSLSNNMFNGTFYLEKFQSLPNIWGLDLSNNNLTVDTNNVNSSSCFPKLQYLKLASCSLHDFPDFIKHSDVKRLDLSNNRIAGEIPSWFWEVGLRAVLLSSNLLTGLQKPFFISYALAILDLSSNQLQGELYLPISKQHVFNPFLPISLIFLSLANNNLSGPIPISLCNATQLKVLDLSHNKFSGTIPLCLLQNLQDLQAFDIGRNNISGHIPDSFSPNCKLTNFAIYNNVLEGEIPKSLENCKSMDFMNVGNNILNDNFPCFLSSSLRVLVLHSNRFQGEVTCLKSWPDLQIIDISSNSFRGSLESLNFSSWKALASDGLLRYNKSGPNFMTDYRYVITARSPTVVTLNIKGTQIEFAMNGPYFTAIDFSSNNFDGEIPDAMGHLVSLYLLNLSHNGLTGAIPKSFGNLKQLGSLDLSTNQLTGKIPEELARLTFLSVLNLSYNKLVGVIPKGPQFQTFTADSFQGNTDLCGDPLNISCISIGDFDVSPTGHENLQPIEWEYVFAAVGYVVGLGGMVWFLLLCPRFRVKYFHKIEEVFYQIYDGIDSKKRGVRRPVRRQ